MAQEQSELELQQEVMQAKQMQQALQAKPNNTQSIQQVTQLTQKRNARKAVLIAEMTKDYMDEEQKIMGEFSGDPLIKLKAREVDLRAKENERKGEEAQERIDLDTAKALMNQEKQEDKLSQNEKLANIRASVSIAKQGIADTRKIHELGRNLKKK